MPPGVVDAFKNLIRHGKHHHNHHNDPLPPRGLRQQPAPPPPPPPPPPIVDEGRKEHSTMPICKGLEGFTLEDKMGDGAFSNVYRAIETATGAKVAVKVVRKFELNASQEGNKHLNSRFKKKPRVTERENIFKEVQIMRGTSHPSIVKLYSFSESEEHYYLVLELMAGGELFHQIVKLTYFSENLARHVILQVAQGIRYLHEERGVVHRDIKPENLLFTAIEIIPSKNPVHRPYDEHKEDEGEFIPGVGGGGIGRVKIADFGLSKVVWNEQTKTPCGTVGYTAPEIVKDERYSKSVDMWALGCVLYTILCGFPPFYDESINVLTEKVARGFFTFLSPWWDDVGPSAKDLISHLLCVDPAQRYTIDEFLAHPWCNALPAPPPPPTPFIYGNSKEPLSGMPLDSPLLAAARGRGHEGRSPGIATLKEAFEITYAVHRLEEEAAQRRKYNGRGGAGARGFLNNWNEDDEDEEAFEEDESDDSESEAPNHQHRGNYYPQQQPVMGDQQAPRTGPRDQTLRQGNIITAAGAGTSGAGGAGVTTTKARTTGLSKGHKGFELDLHKATLLGRRHGKGSVGISSPLKMEGLRVADYTPPTREKERELPQGTGMWV